MLELEIETMLFILIAANALVTDLKSVTSWCFLRSFLWSLRNSWWQGGSKSRFSCSTNTIPYHWVKGELSLAAEWMNNIVLMIYLKLGSGTSELGENWVFSTSSEEFLRLFFNWYFCSSCDEKWNWENVANKHFQKTDWIRWIYFKIINLNCFVFF